MPCSRHQRSTGVGRGKAHDARDGAAQVMGRDVQRRGSAVGERRGDGAARWRGRTPRARVALASGLRRRAAMASWLRVAGGSADERERGVTVTRRREGGYEHLRAGPVPSARGRGGGGRPRPWSGCRRCASSTTGPSGCASRRRTPSRSGRAGTPSAARSCRRRARRRRSPRRARTRRPGRRPRAPGRRCAGSASARRAGATARATRRGRPAPPARAASWLARHSARSASRSSSARSRSRPRASPAKPRAASQAP